MAQRSQLYILIIAMAIIGHRAAPLHHLPLASVRLKYCKGGYFFYPEKKDKISLTKSQKLHAFWLFLVAAGQFWRYVEAFQYFAYTRYIRLRRRRRNHPFLAMALPMVASNGDAASADVALKL